MTRCSGGCWTPTSTAAIVRPWLTWSGSRTGRSRTSTGAGEVNDTSTEWYTLSENLYRAFLATGNPKYRDFAEVWEYRDYWDVYARNGDIFAPRPDGSRSTSYHAYSHVNTLGGAAQPSWSRERAATWTPLRNAYDFLQRDQCFATGGYGPDEQLLPRGSTAREAG